MDQNQLPPTPQPGDEAYVTGVTPYLNPSDAKAAADFYVKAFGAKILSQMPADDGKRLMHCHLVINGGPVMLADAFPEHGYPVEKPAGFVLHLQVDDPLSWWEQAVGAGCQVTMPIREQFWGDQYGALRDPFGYAWSIGGKTK